ncbi:hypothetical protein [Kitasatospora sp. GAS204B]|uniref:hypothetical protein n=1 Tax=unclassified Kitasatospora TaxID=2633591 RepID=UPI0024767C91|nr:hypothetical protein [Kitasatospora sp. GAS204B]MDH6120700.1 hypothetical protein [Kitasatospora sp. GAS204B]
MRIRKLLAAAALAGTVATGALATAGTASASTIQYDCNSSQAMVCLYYNSSNYGYGAYFEQTGNISDYGTNTKFVAGHNGSSGAGTLVKNHAAAVDSWYSGTFTVYYNSGYENCSYACQPIPAWQTVDLNTTLKNNDAAGFFN